MNASIAFRLEDFQAKTKKHFTKQRMKAGSSDRSAGVMLAPS